MDFHYGFYDFVNMDKLIFWQKKPPHQAEVFFIKARINAPASRRPPQRCSR
jgi:hypothetical protein